MRARFVLTSAPLTSPDENPTWLAPSERRSFRRLSVEKRRREWLGGRWVSKRLVSERHGMPGRSAFERIEIASIARGWQRGRPVYRIGGRPGPFSLSICHAAGRAFAALGEREHDEVGIDFEAVEPRDGLAHVALSAEERRRLRGVRGAKLDRLVTLHWVLKEAFLKAVGVGLRVPLESLTARVDPDTEELESPEMEVERGGAVLSFVRRFARRTDLAVLETRPAGASLRVPLLGAAAVLSCRPTL